MLEQKLSSRYGISWNAVKSCWEVGRFISGCSFFLELTWKGLSAASPLRLLHWMPYFEPQDQLLQLFVQAVVLEIPSSKKKAHRTQTKRFIR